MGAFSRRGEKIDDDVTRVFDLFPRLKERRSQKAGTMSGGEQQMLAMGRALMAHPKILLLDEPSMGLSPILTEQIFTIIHEINEQGTTVLLVEQNALMALNAAHRGYVIQTGKIILADTAANSPPTSRSARRTSARSEAAHVADDPTAARARATTGRTCARCSSSSGCCSRSSSPGSSSRR